MRKIKTGDKVKIMRGKDAGKEGEVTSIVEVKKGKNKSYKVIVKGLNIAKKSQKPNPQFGIQGGIYEIEKPIDASNVMVLEGSKVTKVKIVTDKTNKKQRVSKKTNKEIK